MSNVNRLLRQFIQNTSHRPQIIPLHSRAIHTNVHIHAVNKSLPQRLSHAPPRRTFTSSPVARALKSSRPPGEQTKLAAAPSPDLKDEIDLVPLEKATLQMTRRAAEQLHSMAEKQKNPDCGLRVRVDSGGCHGYQYAFELAKSREPEDYVFSHSEVKPANVLVDAVSLALMKGSVIDFATELIGSSFRVEDNPQAKGNGCGCGVSWELKDDVQL